MLQRFLLVLVVLSLLVITSCSDDDSNPGIDAVFDQDEMFDNDMPGTEKDDQNDDQIVLPVDEDAVDPEIDTDEDQIDDEPFDSSTLPGCGDMTTEEYVAPSPEECAYYDANCGIITTPYGTDLDCGTCTDEKNSCGGAGIPNQCGHHMGSYGYEWMTNYPVGDTNNVIYALDANHIWAAGNAHIIHHNGTSWFENDYQLRSGGNFSALWAADKDNVWAAATDGSLLFLSDDGKFDNGYFDEQDKRHYWNEDDGAVKSLWGSGKDSIWAASSRGMLYFDGQRWTFKDTTPRNVQVVFGVSKNNVWAGGEGYIWSYDGRIFNVDTTIEGTIYALEMDCDGTLYAAGKTNDGKPIFIKKSNDSWEDVAIDTNSPLRALARNGQNLFIAGDDGLFMKYDGTAFTDYSHLMGGYDINSLASVDNRVLIAGETGVVGSYDGRFFSFNKTKIPSTVNSVWASYEKDLWIVGNKYFMHWNGSMWKAMYTTYNVTDIYGDAYNNIYAITQENVVLRYNGTYWLVDPDADWIELEKMGVDRQQYLIKNEDGTVGWKFDDNRQWLFNREMKNGLQFEYTDIEQTTKTAIWPFDGVEEMPFRAQALDNNNMVVAAPDSFMTYNGSQWKRYECGDVIADVALTDDSEIYLIADGGIYKHTSPACEKVMDFDDVPQVLEYFNGYLYIGAQNGLYDYNLETGELTQINHGTNSNDFRSLLVTAEDDIWGGGENFVIHFDGLTWEKMLPGDIIERGLPEDETSVIVHRFYGKDRDNIWFLGSSPDDRIAYIFSFNGATWVNDARMDLYGTLRFTDVWGLDSQNAYFTVDQLGWVYHYKDVGPQGMIDYVWGACDTPLGAVWGTDNNNIWVFGPNGNILNY